MTALFKIDTQNKRVFAHIEQVPNLTRRSIRQGWFMLGKDLKETANKEILRKPKSGRTYIIRTRGGRRRRHVASAPGETHANLSGDLRRSLGYQVHGALSMDFGYGVEADQEAPIYGGVWEFNANRAIRRPSLLNAINALARNAENYFDNEFNKRVN